MEIGYQTFPSGKQYAYVKDKGTVTTAEGSPIFLRNIMFITKVGDPHTIAIVREWGSRRATGAWEPPKGQMEWKEFVGSAKSTHDFLHIRPAALARFQREGVLREVEEEAKIRRGELRRLRRMPYMYVEAFKGAGAAAAARFGYQFWTAEITEATMLEAQKRIADLVAHPDWVKMLPADVCEKDGIQWFNPARDDWSLIRGGFSKKMTLHYFDLLKKA
jgi:8-oxo-dGTP pyrophosphatase MutT (NUDIX family)